MLLNHSWLSMVNMLRELSGALYSVEQQSFPQGVVQKSSSWVRGRTMMVTTVLFV